MDPDAVDMILSNMVQELSDLTDWEMTEAQVEHLRKINEMTVRMLMLQTRLLAGSNLIRDIAGQLDAPTA